MNLVLYLLKVGFFKKRFGRDFETNLNIFLDKSKLLFSFTENSSFMAKLYCCLLFISFLQSSLSQTITGKVLHKKTGTPLSYTSIEFGDKQKPLISDSAGNFRLIMQDSAAMKLIITVTGFYPVRLTVYPPDTSLVIYLEEAIGQLEEVVVTGVGTTAKIRSTPIAISVVTAKEFSYHANGNAIDAIARNIPGLQSVTTGPNVSKPSIRGLGYNRVLTLFDGVRQEGQQWADEHGIEADQYNISRAEVIKGPASISYGSDAVAGVINLIPFVPTQQTKTVKGDVLLEYHTNNNMAAFSAGLHQFKGDVFWVARGSAKTAKDYRNPVDGRVYNTGFREWNGSASAGLKKSWGQSYIVLTSFNDQQEIPDGSRDSTSRAFTRQVYEATKDDINHRPRVSTSRLSSYRIDPLHQHIRHYRAYNKTSVKWGANTINNILSFTKNIRQEYNHPTFPQQAGLYLVLNTYQFSTTYNTAFKNDIHLTTGINAMYQTSTSKNGTDFPIPDYAMSDAGIFLLLEKEWKNFSISGGIRSDHRQLRWNNFYIRTNPATGFDYHIINTADTANTTLAFDQYSHHFRGISASLGFTYTISPRLFIKANIARGYRSPNITEVGANGFDPGAHIYYIGNRSFLPECNWQQDIGVFFNMQGLEFGLEIYNNTISNYIFQQKLLDAAGQPVEIIPGNSTYGYQQGRARLYGFDGTVKYKPSAAKWLCISGLISSVTGINKDAASLKQFGSDAKYLPLISPLRMQGTVQVTCPSKSVLIKSPYIRMEADRYAVQKKYYAVQQTETGTPAYQLINAGIGCTINRQNNALATISINAENIFNITYQSHLNRLKYFEDYTSSPNGRSGIYDMGRNISLKTVFNF